MIMRILWSNTTQAPRKSHITQSTLQKYCSDRCRREKPRPGRSMEPTIEMAFVRLLGDGREKRIVNCEEVQNVVFSMARRRAEGTEEQDNDDKRVGLLDAAGRGKEEQGSDDSDDDATEDEDGGVRLPCGTEERPATATTTTTTTTIMRSKMDKAPRSTREEWGMDKAKEREMVRRAARRGVAFGFEIEEGRRRRVEAVQGGRRVESSFAKGEWGVRWCETEH